jgi:hypothetical protein
VQARVLKASMAACVLGTAMLAVWGVARLRDARREPAAQPVSQGDEGRRLTEPPPPAPPRSTARIRRPPQGGKPVGRPQVMPPSNSVYLTTGPPARPAPVQTPPSSPEEAAARRVLEPLVARRPNTQMPFVSCRDPGGWKQGSAESGEITDPLDVPARDPSQAVCRARLQARDRDVLVDLLKDASGAYQGHLATTELREHLDAYLGRWFQVEIQVDTAEPYPVPDP